MPSRDQPHKRSTIAQTLRHRGGARRSPTSRRTIDAHPFVLLDRAESVTRSPEAHAGARRAPCRLDRWEPRLGQASSQEGRVHEAFPRGNKSSGFARTSPREQLAARDQGYGSICCPRAGQAVSLAQRFLAHDCHNRSAIAYYTALARHDTKTRIKAMPFVLRKQTALFMI